MFIKRFFINSWVVILLVNFLFISFCLFYIIFNFKFIMESELLIFDFFKINSLNQFFFNLKLYLDINLYLLLNFISVFFILLIFFCFYYKNIKLIYICSFLCFLFNMKFIKDYTILYEIFFNFIIGEQALQIKKDLLNSFYVNSIIHVNPLIVQVEWDFLKNFDDYYILKTPLSLLIEDVKLFSELENTRIIEVMSHANHMKLNLKPLYYFYYSFLMIFFCHYSNHRLFEAYFYDKFFGPLSIREMAVF